MDAVTGTFMVGDLFHNRGVRETILGETNFREATVDGSRKQGQRISRRRWLAGAAGAAAPVGLVGCGGAGSGGIGPALTGANELVDHPLPPERVDAVLRAARMNRAFFQAVRDLEIPDLVEPAVTFVARGPESGGEA